MERKYIMQLPRGAKVSSADIKYEDGKIVLTAQLEEWKPEDGDLVYVKAGYEYIAVYKNETIDDLYVYANLNMSFSISKIVVCDTNPLCCIHDIKELRPITNSEKQRFLAAMAKEGKRWNAEKKVMEDVRWRAEAEGYYYRINGLIGETPDVSVCQDFRSPRSNTDYEIGNYFKTKQAAVIAGNQVADVIKNSKAE